MNKILSDFFKKQYDQFKEHLVSNWGINQRYVDKLDVKLKPIHKRYLSLACAATVIGYRVPRNEYIMGLVEASHLCLILALKGLENPSCALLRQSIELVLKHIFFATHGVEYEWARSREDYKDLTFQKLLEYLSRTEECRKLKPCHDICVKLDERFGLLSRHVHVHSRRFMHYSRPISGYVPKQEIVERLNNQTKEVWPRLISILVVMFANRYFRASAIEQDLIKSGLSPDLRKQVDRYLANHI